jgi:hypothetical protein
MGGLKELKRMGGKLKVFVEDRLRDLNEGSLERRRVEYIRNRECRPYGQETTIGYYSRHLDRPA